MGKKRLILKPIEIKAFKPLLENIDIKDKIVTADAMHAQKGHAEYIKKQDGDYVFVVKKN